MSVESDGVGESFDEQMRIGTMAAMQVGQRMAQMRADSMRRTQEQSQQQAQELQRRMEAERRAAAVELSAVQNSDWWRDARPEDVADKYAAAHAWKDEDPEIARHEERMRRELQDRYGIDPSRNDGEAVDAERLREEIRRIEERQAETEQTQADQDRAEAREAQDRAATADERAREGETRANTELDPERERAERNQAERDRAEANAHNGDANHAYDSSERREAEADRMRQAGGNQEQIDTATRADQAQGRPAQDAVRNQPGRAASQPHGRSTAAQRGRGPQRVR